MLTAHPRSDNREVAHDELVAAATVVRVACERVAPALGYDADTLGGFCPFAAFAAVQVLTEASFQATLVAGRFAGMVGHFWAEVRLGPSWRPHHRAVVDVTATQFEPSWEPATVLMPDDVRQAEYAFIVAEGARAFDTILHEDADMLQVLPARWWARADEPAATLDARVLTRLRARRDSSLPDARDVAASVGATEREVLEAFGRLAARPAIHGRDRRRSITRPSAVDAP